MSSKSMSSTAKPVAKGEKKPMMAATKAPAAPKKNNAAPKLPKPATGGNYGLQVKSILQVDLDAKKYDLSGDEERLQTKEYKVLDLHKLGVYSYPAKAGAAAASSSSSASLKNLASKYLGGELKTYPSGQNTMASPLCCATLLDGKPCMKPKNSRYVPYCLDCEKLFT